MTSHPFEASSSPNFALVKTAQMFSNRSDRHGQNAVQDSLYVDDCLISVSSVEQAKSFVKQINELMSREGFKLKKWASNSELVTAVFPKFGGGLTTVDMPSGHGVTQIRLGLEWDTKLNVFRFCFDRIEKPLTRRGIMSVVSSSSDPLGLISPTCLPTMQLLQKLHKTRSIRQLLLPISNDLVLQEETSITCTVGVEKILNNRPLVPVTTDVNDRLCLTPNNLLLLRDCDSIAIESGVQDKCSRCWRQINCLANVSWRRCREEYLPTLRCRQEWLMQHRNFRENVVIVFTDRMARGF
ncbi:hypothetical protein MN116_000544 [Schistosoma mekongi]|uniref:Reverse transcriptase domain-containing protein n=1 Tax=Schistosoma mekongi TaxID=38744 RepID=A0AAE1ZBC5_SCHME|nr:hypothetical protein MN116_000544 [Schistosoma mekongi]